MAKPLLNIHCKTEPECEYPTDAWLAMDDGTVQKYVLVSRPDLKFQKVWDSLQISIGYQYMEKPRRKNRIHRCDR